MSDTNLTPDGSAALDWAERDGQYIEDEYPEVIRSRRFCPGCGKHIEVEEPT